MQKDYTELAKQQQQDYQRSRNPFEYGQQVAQRRYSEIISGLQNQQQATQQSYGDLFSQARQRAVKGQAMGGPTLSGGMGQQQRDYVSAIEMQELGRIGQAREGAMRDLYTQGQAAFSNAQLEGQQATQMELQNQQARLGTVQQTQQILQDTKLTEEEKRQQLDAIGVNFDDVKEQNKSGGILGLLGWDKLMDGDVTTEDVGRAVFRTALAAGAIYFFAPAAVMLAKGIGAKLLSLGSVSTAGGVLGKAGWAKIFSWFTTKGVASAGANVAAGAAARAAGTVATTGIPNYFNAAAAGAGALPMF